MSSAFKPAVNRVIEPIARLAIRAKITPNAVTLIGTAGTIIAALYFYPRGDLFIGTLFISFFALSDLFDGAIARLSERGASAWGGFLDSTCDRLTDSAILGGVAIYCILEDIAIYPVVISSIVIGFLVPYIRAKAESFGIACTVGIAERTERIILALTGIGLDGLGLPYALSISMWLLLALGVVTVIQRIVVVRKGLI
ncbi:PgsA Phosphatidylglycerophosphate synthase [Candidatus Nanopelagicaceae bacterium]